MRTDIRSADFCFRWKTNAVAVAVIALPIIVWAGMLDDVAQAPVAVFEKAEEVARKSQQGYMEAVRDAPPPENNGSPFTRDDLQGIKDKNERILNSSNALADAQQKLANSAADALGKVPTDHPKYGAIKESLARIASQMPETKKQVQIYKQKVRDDTQALNQWDQRHDPTYVPPVPPRGQTLHPGSS